MSNARGNCGCGWTGPWRPNPADAHQDAAEHCVATGCLLGVPVETVTSDTMLPGELMPHERQAVGVEAMMHFVRRKRAGKEVVVTLGPELGMEESALVLRGLADLLDPPKEKDVTDDV